MHPDWNWREAENDIDDEDLAAASDYYDRKISEALLESISRIDIKSALKENPSLETIIALLKKQYGNKTIKQ